MKTKNCSIFLLLLFFFLQTNFLYSFGTGFTSLSWRMKPEMIEDGTNKELEIEHSSIDKIKIYSHKLRITDKGRLADVKYYFYKNGLYKIEIKKDLAIYKKEILKQLILMKGLNKEFNNIIQTLNNGSKYETTEDNQKILLYLNSNDLNSSDIIYLNFKSIPFANQINSTNSRIKL